MAMRAATMSSMNPIDPSPGVRESDSLFRKVVLLLLLISAASLWIVILFKRETMFPLLLSTFFADASLGLIAGFGARFVLRRQKWFAQLLTAVLVVVIGMIMIGSLTDSVLGIGPIRLEPKLASQIREMRLSDLPDGIRTLQIESRVFDVSKMDWADPIHLGISLMIVVLSLQAWRRPVATISQPVEVAPLPAAPAPRVTRSRRGRRATTSANANGRARVKATRSWHTRPRPGATTGPRPHSNNGSRSPVLQDARKKKDSVVRPKRRRSRRKPQIQFALVEEHRCPYCLDNVSRNDPRGVKECEVCHTLHHADCWAITGICQVPHLNT